MIHNEWTQPGGFSWRVCTVGEMASDECDPTANATRDNAFAFITVFAVQCCAIALGHVVLKWKLRRMVRQHKKHKRRAMADPRLEQRARRFVANAKTRENEARGAGGKGPKLSARTRFRRAVIVAKFSARVMKASREQETVDDVVLEISEAVAAHWKASTPYFVAAGTSAMTITFCIAGFTVGAQTA